jgi:nucleoside-diphosphate-sugar epimerase
MSPRLVVLGCGFLGGEAARQALAAGREVVATTRDPARAAALAAVGVRVHLAPALTPEDVAVLVTPGAEVLVAFPPDGATDAAIAPRVAGAGAVAYVSTTGVYGEARGRVDESTAVDPRTPRAALRLAAEEAWRRQGACILRAAGIYGPGRGLHRRLADPSWRIPGDGSNVVSRIHVEDLAALALGALRARVDGTWVVADARPVPQLEAIRWLCERTGRPEPPFAPLAEVSETLRHDRRVDGSALRARLGVTLRYPGYGEGFAACLEAEARGRVWPVT